MYFRFNNHAYRIVARTTDDFGVTTETGIDWVYGNVAIHQYEHDKLGTPINNTYRVQDLDANHKPTGILIYQHRKTPEQVYKLLLTRLSILNNNLI